jgi:hypothetical protein
LVAVEDLSAVVALLIAMLPLVARRALELSVSPILFYQFCANTDMLIHLTVEAILLFGEVQHTGGQSYSVLSGAPYSSNNPLSGERLANMNRFTGVLRSYCDAADPQCASTGPGPFDIAKHLDYFELYTQDAAGWAKSKLGF